MEEILENEVTNEEKPKEPYELWCTVFEVRNLYIDNDENVTCTNKILECIKEWSNNTDNRVSYAYILHDKDIYMEDEFNQYFQLEHHKGEKKKEHYHLYVHLPYGMQLGSIATKLECEYTRLQIVKPNHWDNKLLYLTHLLHPDKYQYPINEVVSNVWDYCNYLYEKALKNIPVIPRVNKILADKYNSQVTFAWLCEELSNYGIYGKILKDNWGIIRDLVNEHNRLVKNDDDIAVQVDKAKMQAFAKAMKENAYLEKLLNTFDSVKVAETENTYTELMAFEKKKKK